MNLIEIQNGVTSICRDVGLFIKKEGEAFDLSRIEQKTTFNNLVSYVDKEAEKRLVSVLKELVPGSGFITEEGTVKQSSDQEYRWIIDPLDGTTNFLHGLPIFSVSVGLARNNEVVVGCVYDIGRDECYYATKGKGAYCNGERIHVSKLSTVSESLLATGFPYDQFDKGDVYLGIIKEFLKESHGIRRLGSAAIDLIYVACGRLEGFFEFNLNPWDVAAGTLIVQEAGGIVTDFKGGSDFIFGGELCAANAGIHAEMLQIIKVRWGY